MMWLIKLNQSTMCEKFQTPQDFADFVETHGMTPYLDEMTPVATAIDRKKIRQRLTLRLRARDAEKLRKLAHKLGRRTESIAEEWIQERLTRESVKR